MFVEGSLTRIRTVLLHKTIIPRKVAKKRVDSQHRLEIMLVTVAYLLYAQGKSQGGGDGKYQLELQCKVL